MKDIKKNEILKNIEPPNNEPSLRYIARLILKPIPGDVK